MRHAAPLTENDMTVISENLLIIRTSTKTDVKDLLNVQAQAFGKEEGPEIVDLVDKLLSDPSAHPLLSLVATREERTIGHILFTNARIRRSKKSLSAAILAPLAVLPDAQNQGVGGRLIKEGLRLLSDSGVELLFVLGHPGYYPRYGFKPAGAYGFEAPYPIPDKNADAWMVQALRPGVMDHTGGQVICANALDQPAYWRE